MTKSQVFLVFYGLFYGCSQRSVVENMDQAYSQAISAGARPMVQYENYLYKDSRFVSCLINSSGPYTTAA